MASVRGAEELGAEQVPSAALQLQLAREQVANAKALMEDGENERAFYTAKRATEDADLAIALVREARARESSSEAKARVQAAAEETL
jgi:hypothetical protein